MQFPLYTTISGFGLGVLWRSFFDFGLALSLFVALLGAVIIALSFLLTERAKILFIGILVISIGCGMVRFDIADQYRGSARIEANVGAAVTLEGIVVDEPDRRENTTNYTVLLERLGDTEVHERVHVIADSYPTFTYGDRVRLSGRLSKPESFTTDSGREFDYAAYLSKDDIFYEIIFPKIEFVSHGHGNVIKRYLFGFKYAFLREVRRLIPDPEVSLLGGLVVGAKQSLGAKLQEDFRTTGIIHIVVLSGYNVSIVADAIMRSLSFLPQMIGVSLGALSIVLFAIMVGGSATIVRASIMALLVVLARATGRTNDMTRALFLAGFVMLLHNPKILAHDASFQLSFLATLGLILLAPIVERRLWFVPTRFQFREFATATVATQIFVLPFLLYKMGTLSLVALPVNLLVLVTVPITMLFGFLAGVIGFLSSTLATPFAFIAHLLLSYQLGVVEFFAKLPFASVQVSVFPALLMVGVYSVYGYFLWRAYRTPNVPAIAV